MRQVGKCCGEPLHWLIAEAPSGCGLTLTVGSGVPVRLWRCAWCECVTVEGWVPPTWVNAITARVLNELDEGLADAIADAYTAGDSDA